MESHRKAIDIQKRFMQPLKIEAAKQGVSFKRYLEQVLEEKAVDLEKNK